MDRDFQGNGRFTVLRQLGAGGMGVVYEALDREKNVTVALKALRHTSADAILRMKREFRALQELHHPNLVNLGELGEADGTWFFTMELVHGSNFLDYLRGISPHDPTGDFSLHLRNSLPSTTDLHGGVKCLEQRGAPRPASIPAYDEERLRDGMIQLTRGLLALHQAGKIHRDVKPSNIIVDSNGRVVLLDFGLVAEADPAQASSTANVVGTAAYMAPEQALGRHVGPEADWYSVGVILYEVLVGALPFDGSPLEILIDKQRRRPPSPRSRRGDVPEHLDRLCVELLDFDPGQRPGGETLLRQFGVRASAISLRPALAAGSTSTQSPSFVGREAELFMLQAALSDCRDGQQINVLVRGESGIGKTALLRAFTDHAALDARVVVLSGRCHEREAVPYKAMDGVVDALARYMQRLPKHEAAALIPQRASLLLQVFPVLRHVDVLATAPHHDVVDPQEVRIRVFGAMRELFVRLAERHPLIVAIEDLQWADTDGLTLLGELTRQPDAPPFLLVASWRAGRDQVAGVEQRLADVLGAVRDIQLGPLPESAACELAERLLVRASGDLAAGPDNAAIIAREAAGHPLFIDELVRHSVLSHGDSRPPSADGVWRLEDVLHDRIGRMGETSRRIIEVIAVAGMPIDQETTARAVGIDLASFSRQVALLRIVNLARTTGTRPSDTVEPYHDRVRDAVLGLLSPIDRAARHRDLARALDASGRADPEALLAHHLGAGETERAGRCAARAGEIAARALAFDQAARFFELALELLPKEDEVRKGLRVSLGDAYANAGRGAEAAHAYLAAAPGASAAEAFDLQRRAGQQLLVGGHIDEGVATMRQVLRQENIKYPSTPRRALLTVLKVRTLLRLRGFGFVERDESLIPRADLMRLDACFHIGLALGLADNVRGQAFTSLGLLLALRAGEPYRLARALIREATFRATMGGKVNLRRAEVLFALSERLTQRQKQPYLDAFLTSCRGQVAYFACRFREAVAFCEEADTIFRERCVGTRWELGWPRLWWCRAQQQLGDYARLSSRLPSMLQECEQRNDLYGATNLRTAVLPFVHLAGDEPDRARLVAGEALRWSSAGFHVQHFYSHVAEMSAFLYELAATKAHEAIRATWPRFERVLLFRVQTIWMVMLDLRARAALGMAAEGGPQRSRCLREAARDARRLERLRMPWSDALACLLRAGIALQEGDEERGRLTLIRAIEASDAIDLQLHAGAARLRLGRLLGGSEGQAMAATAQQAMGGLGIRSPARFAAMLLPSWCL